MRMANTTKARQRHSGLLLHSVRFEPIIREKHIRRQPAATEELILSETVDIDSQEHATRAIRLLSAKQLRHDEIDKLAPLHRVSIK